MGKMLLPARRYPLGGLPLSQSNIHVAEIKFSSLVLDFLNSFFVAVVVFGKFLIRNQCGWVGDSRGEKEAGCGSRLEATTREISDRNGSRPLS